MENRTCNVCMEDKQPKKYCPGNFLCHNCQSGFVCDSCIQKYDPCGSIFELDDREVLKILKCPCCRQLNWRYQYTQFVKITLDNDIYDTSAYNDIPVVKNIFLKNFCEANGFDYEDDE